MNIIGISHDVPISSIALIIDGVLKYALPEERITRVKLDRRFPFNALKAALKEHKMELDDIEHFVVSWNPGQYFRNFNPVFSANRRYKAEYFYSIPDYLMRLSGETVERVEQTLHGSSSFLANVHYINHHDAHIGNAYFLSPFESAAILTCDGRGEITTTQFAIGRGNEIEYLKRIEWPHSLGMFFGAITNFLGYRPDSDEWKVMALSAYANPADTRVYYKKMRELVILHENEGEFELNLRYFNHFNVELPNLYSPALCNLLGEPRKKNDKFSERHYAIAAAAQMVFEEVMDNMLIWLQKRSGERTICLAGGSIMNSVYNGKILKNTSFKDTYISPCPDDSGNSIGGVFFFWNRILKKDERFHLNTSYLGGEVSAEAIHNAIQKCKITNYVHHQNVEAETAKLLADGNLVGWFQGRAEFGQRALGNRSIIADPRRADVKDRVNSAVKYREFYRPFAPAVLQEKAMDYFDAPGGRFSSVLFMEKVYSFKEDRRAEVPAVVHADGTGRLQTVDSKSNPRFYALIKEFEKLTSVPIILNTSFNLNGDPIVHTPTDAIRTFYSCGLDVLVMGDYIVKK